MKQETKTRKPKVFSAEEHAAMRDHVQELRTGAEGDSVVLAKISEMKEPDRSMAKKLHAIIKASAPILTPKLWYGMPAYARDDKIVCHYQPAYKFKTRYPMLGFSDKANLDEGTVWPVYFAVTELNSAAEAKIAALVKKAVS